MKAWGLRVAWATLGLLHACLQTHAALEPITLRSRSGQFMVHGIPVNSLPQGGRAPTNTILRLDPAVMAVSCERVKEALLAELDATDGWRDAIRITLRPVRRHDEPIDLLSTRFRDTWNYQVSMPDQMPRANLLEALVQILLLEMAQRDSLDQSAEIPAWLVKGLAAHLETTALGALTLEPHTSTVAAGRRRDPVGATRELLRATKPLTIEQLSWPRPEQLSGHDGGLYKACAHLMTQELLRLENGPRSLRRTISALPRYLNWQTAFLRGFTEHFQKMVDVEKWWALRTTHFTGVETMSLWTAEHTVAQLDAALIAEVQVRESTNNLPRTDRLTLQQVLTRARGPQREALIQAKIQLLDVVRLRAASGLAPMVEAYENTLRDYLRSPRMTYSAVEPGSVPRKLSLAEAVEKLDDLDNDREALRRQIGFSLTEAEPE
jgi:hypothetical protein